MRRLSKLALHQEIKKLNRLDPARASFDRIKQILDVMTFGLKVVIGLTQGNELFFRARKNPNTKPLAVRELAAPPSELITGFQRCNPPGVPMFYSSSRRITALLECDVKPGDIVYISQWIGKDKIPVNRIFETGFDNGDFAYEEVEDILLLYFDTIFTKRIHKEFSDDYKFTAAVSQFLTSNFPKGPEFDIRVDGNVAIRYPSVLDRDNAFNTAMHSIFADDRLELLHVMELLIRERSEADVLAEVSDNAIQFDDGEIQWSGDRNKIPQFREKTRAVPFIFDGSRWQLALHAGEISGIDLQAILYE